MSAYIDIMARVLARRFGRAIHIRDTSSLESDPDPVFGIAPIRLVAEQQVQAVAYGTFGAPPHVLVRWNPLGRQARELEPFAQALDS